MKCELCTREMKKLTVHHLIPRQHTKRKNLAISSTVDIGSACHRQIQVLFNNKRLAKELNTIEALQAEPQMGKFLAWVRKQNSQKQITVRHQK